MVTTSIVRNATFAAMGVPPTLKLLYSFHSMCKLLVPGYESAIKSVSATLMNNSKDSMEYYTGLIPLGHSTTDQGVGDGDVNDVPAGIAEDVVVKHNVIEHRAFKEALPLAMLLHRGQHQEIVD